jgi:sulfate adenylyltransferase
MKLFSRIKLTNKNIVNSVRCFSSAPPHGGNLVDLMVTSAEQTDLIKSADFTIELNERQSCDTQLLMCGGFSPLHGFMNEKTYNHVLENMRLPDSNLLFGLPVVLDTTLPESAFKPGQNILLKYDECNMAVLTLDDVYTPNKAKETKLAYGTSELEHPGVRMVAIERGPRYISGKLQGLEFPKRIYPTRTPKELREILPSKDGKDVVAFQCRNPIHRAHYELFTVL